MPDTQVPVTVLTGYLGAGKTTLLNRILSAEHGKRYAVIVNEFGQLGIAHELIVEWDKEVYEMNKGGMCCTVGGALRPGGAGRERGTRCTGAGRRGWDGRWNPPMRRRWRGSCATRGQTSARQSACLATGRRGDSTMLLGKWFRRLRGGTE